MFQKPFHVIFFLFLFNVSRQLYNIGGILENRSCYLKEIEFDFFGIFEFMMQYNLLIEEMDMNMYL